MKNFKNILLIFIIFLLVGCDKNWKNKIQISELKYDGTNIIGEIKNLTDSRYKLYIKFKFKSGTLEKQGNCDIVVESKQTTNLKCENKDINDSYSIEINNIELNEIRKDEMIYDEIELKNYPKIKKKSNEIISFLKKYPEFENMKFYYLSICYDECISAEHPIIMHYNLGSNKGLRIEFNSRYQLKQIDISGNMYTYPSIVINKSEKIALSNLFNIDENSILKDNLNDYNNIINNNFSQYRSLGNSYIQSVYTSDELFYIFDMVAFDYMKFHSFSISYR